MPQSKDATKIEDYRFPDKRTNIPPAGLAAQGKVAKEPPTRYFYDPHLSPVLRSDPTGQADNISDLLEKAAREKLSPDEIKLLQQALQTHQPWLEWTGKREKPWFDVDPVALHIHERLSTQAILKLAQREPIQRSMFADPEFEYRQSVQFYQHSMNWSNRLILGDSLTVMHSLAKRENLAGKVQMIYMDPPYGIKFGSNFQPLINKRDVKDKPEDLTREPEQIKAYRDTWTLGVHTYLTYLRDRLTVARELLTDRGSIFVQISDENLHRVRALLDEVFGSENFLSIIAFKKTSGFSSSALDNVLDFIIWYAKNKENTKFNMLLEQKDAEEQIGIFYDRIELPSGERRTVTKEEVNTLTFPKGAKVFQGSVLYSDGSTTGGSYPITLDGKTYQPPSNAHWKTNLSGMQRLLKSNRVYLKGNTIRYVRYFEDYPYYPITNTWNDTSFGGFVGDQKKLYVVQTYTKVIERCLLMTTEPGDLVLDPTCGSGTTAYVAEQWGHRWITTDTSRVSIAIARQRILTAKFDYFNLAEQQEGVSGGFIYKSVPHITLKSIAQNPALDPVFARWEGILSTKLTALNSALANVTPDIRTKLESKLAAKERVSGKASLNDADFRRWRLPRDKWQEWEVPFESDPDWPQVLQVAFNDYRQAWRKKMDEINATVAASASPKKLVDQPKVVKDILRVSGPFTVEGVQPAEESLEFDSPITDDQEDLSTFSAVGEEPANAEAYLEKMVRLLRQDGLRFSDNKIVKFNRLDPYTNSLLNAEGEWEIAGESHRVAVSFGPQYGPITAKQVEDCLRAANRSGFDDLVFAGFTVDAAAQGVIKDDPNPNVHCHLAHIRPDVNMDGLLKDSPNSQLFTVFGLPRVNSSKDRNGENIIEMEGVDIYDPVTNQIHPTGATKVAAWFLDGDYDGSTFCVTQAFFPDNKAWDKLANDLKTTVDPERFEAFSGTVSLPFPTGPNHRAAVKVIDPRGNEVMTVVNL